MNPARSSGDDAICLSDSPTGAERLRRNPTRRGVLPSSFDCLRSVISRAESGSVPAGRKAATIGTEDLSPTKNGTVGAGDAGTALYSEGGQTCPNADTERGRTTAATSEYLFMGASVVSEV